MKPNKETTLCKFNEGVQCTPFYIDNVCPYCGWNPEVNEQRSKDYDTNLKRVTVIVSEVMRVGNKLLYHTKKYLVNTISPPSL